MKVYIIYGLSLPSVQSILHAFASGSVRMMPLGKIWEFALVRCNDLEAFTVLTERYEVVNAGMVTCTVHN